MSYEINVSKKGRHYFSTNPNSLQTEDDAQRLYNHFLKLFPEDQFYEVNVDLVKTGGLVLTDEFKARSKMKMGVK